MTRIERWKSVPSYEDLYEVSELGRVRSLDRIDSRGQHRKGRTLRPGRRSNGYYLFVNLCSNCNVQKFNINVLVLMAFRGPRPSKKHVARHLDDESDNNQLPNLQWGTSKENKADAIRNGKQPRGERHGLSKLTEAQVIEFALQRAGYAAAFRNSRVVEAITGGSNGAMAVTYIQWSGATEQQQIIGWRIIRDAASAAAFADELAAAERLVASGSTSLSGAIDMSRRLLDDSLAATAARRVIDISGDGYNNSGRLPTFARDEALAEGIVINGLAILKNEPLLDGYYQRNIMGGPGAFVLTANDFGDFAEAILGKLVREVAMLRTSERESVARSDDRATLSFH